MKHTDKFVLVPIERYERLIRGNSSNKNEGKHEEEVRLHQKGEGGENKGEDLKEDFSKINKLEGVGEDKKVIENRENKKEADKKVPAPPPGIPNKIKKEDFKWMVLFK